MKRGMWWPIGITGVLATTVAANIWVAFIANDDPSFAIEQDYYKKAITWDTTLAQGRHNVALGWRLTPTIGLIGRDGSAMLSAHLTDSTGASISDAVLHVAALHVARANDVLQSTLAPSGDGVYSLRLDAARAGQWELRFDVQARSTHFTEIARVEAYNLPTSSRR